MDQPVSTIIRQRLRARVRLWINRIRGLKFRQWMGVVLILRTFNPIIIPLGLLLIFYFFVLDLGRNPVIVASRAQIESGTAAVRQDVAELQGAIDDIAEDFRALGQILEPIVSVVKVIVDTVNDIIEFISFGLASSIRLPEIPSIPDFGLTFGLFSSIRAAVVDSLQALGDAYDQLVLTFAKWWRVLRFFLFFTVVWLALSYFSGFYVSIVRGLDLVRGGPGAPAQDDRKPRTWDGRPVFETPPILVLDRAQVTVPTVHSERPAARKGAPTQRILRRRRVLLSAQGVWPDRHLDLFHYELADQADEDAWARFWDRLIARGLDPAEVQLVLSPDTRVIAPVTKVYLPQATVQRAVQATVQTG